MHFANLQTHILAQVSVFGESMWEWRDERKAYYLHQFSKEQPDLDFFNPQVVQEMHVSIV